MWALTTNMEVYKKYCFILQSPKGVMLENQFIMIKVTILGHHLVLAFKHLHF